MAPEGFVLTLCAGHDLLVLNSELPKDQHPFKKVVLAPTKPSKPRQVSASCLLLCATGSRGSGETMRSPAHEAEKAYHG